MSNIDFVIATRHLGMTERCIESIKATEMYGSIIIVMRPEVGYTTQVEQGWRGAREKYVCFVNDDAHPNRKALLRMVEELERDEKIAATGPCIPCRTHQGSEPRAEKRMAVEVPFLTSACILVRRSVLEEIGGWDTAYTLYACDVDLSYRMVDAGYRLVWVRDAYVNHILGASSSRVPEKDELSARDHSRLQQKFPGRLAQHSIIPTEPVNERPTPEDDGIAERRYRLAKEIVNGAKRVLDLGCGWGTGARVFSDAEYTGIEIDEECVEWAEAHLPGKFLDFPVDTPFFIGGEPFKNFDAVCAFEIIEHVKNPQQMLENARRHLTDDGVMVLSTPDRQGVYNPHHLQEWNQQELEALLLHYFEDVKVQVADLGFLAPTLWAECAKPRRERNAPMAELAVATAEGEWS